MFLMLAFFGCADEIDCFYGLVGNWMLLGWRLVYSFHRDLCSPWKGFA